jgi:hypothetical protein
MTRRSVAAATTEWSAASLLRGSPRGQELWNAYERSRTQVFALTRAEQESFYGLERGEITVWQHSLALGALERAVEQRGAAWDALADFAGEVAPSFGDLGERLLGGAPTKPAVSLHYHIDGGMDDAMLPAEDDGVRRRDPRDDPATDYLREATAEARSEGR